MGKGKDTGNYSLEPYVHLRRQEGRYGGAGEKPDSEGRRLIGNDLWADPWRVHQSRGRRRSGAERTECAKAQGKARVRETLGGV